MFLGYRTSSSKYTPKVMKIINCHTFGLTWAKLVCLQSPKYFWLILVLYIFWLITSVVSWSYCVFGQYPTLSFDCVSHFSKFANGERLLGNWRKMIFSFSYTKYFTLSCFVNIFALNTSDVTRKLFLPLGVRVKP